MSRSAASPSGPASGMERARGAHLPSTSRVLEQRLPPDHGEAFGRRHVFCLVSITAIAAVLRLLHLGEWSIWVDEAHTWRDSTMDLKGEQGFLREDRVFYP